MQHLIGHYGPAQAAGKSELMRLHSKLCLVVASTVLPDCSTPYRVCKQFHVPPNVRAQVVDLRKRAALTKLALERALAAVHALVNEHMAPAQEKMIDQLGPPSFNTPFYVWQN
jgi:hypothetical protein